ncbi:LVIVD repeat-containing protein [Nonomuraea sp. NPDC049309]|mgnify:CR=1 FL=1|uniref:LVIVD repeat-containing protein n=1 Tax=Nonomuraea sp. NPDC049309 TaxID=3364350 RepID=UPI00371985DC
MSLSRRSIVVAAAATVLALAGMPAASADIPPADTVVHSPNVTHVLNIPKPDPIADTINTDIAFQDGYAYVGNYGGFSIYDIRKPEKAKVVSSVVCPGSQMDVSVYGNLLFAAVDSSRSDDSCNSESQSATIKESWEGVRIFDISDKTNPKYIKAVETNCGSHTLTLVPGKGPDKNKNVYIYVSSYQPADNFPDCPPPHDKISIIKVPLRNPAAAEVAATPVVFPDGGNETQPGLLLPTSGCHDITAYAEKDIAAGACMGDGVLFDIKDRLNPKVIARVTDPNFAFWHSATFSNDAKKVVFTDELGGGGAATCNEATGPNRGADAIYEIVHGKLVFKSYFKISRYQDDSENCVAHNGSLIPVKGRDIMVQAWYMGGLSIWDFTDSTRPREIGYFERGPRSDGNGGGIWSAYYYNGYIYGADFHEGLDIVKIDDRLTDSAKHVHTNRLNVQTQESYRGGGPGHGW